MPQIYLLMILCEKNCSKNFLTVLYDFQLLPNSPKVMTKLFSHCVTFEMIKTGKIVENLRQIYRKCVQQLSHEGKTSFCCKLYCMYFNLYLVIYALRKPLPKPYCPRAFHSLCAPLLKPQIGVSD